MKSGFYRSEVLVSCHGDCDGDDDDAMTGHRRSLVSFSCVRMLASLCLRTNLRAIL